MWQQALREWSNVRVERGRKRLRHEANDEDLSDAQLKKKLRGFAGLDLLREFALGDVVATELYFKDIIGRVSFSLQRLTFRGKPVDLQYPQKMFCQAAIISLLPAIYGDQWPRYRTKVMREYSLTKEHKVVFFNGLRQLGKTFCNALLACAMIAHVPNMSYALFAQKEDTAKNLLSVFRSIFPSTGCTLKPAICNTERSVYEFKKDSDVRSIICRALTQV
jgi:hypothetical protein